MQQSLSYYLTKWVIRLKGIKKIFSQDPVNYQQIRKEDVFYPKARFFKANALRNFTIENTTVTEVKTPKASDQLVLFLHGGAFISGPAQHHWDSLQTIVQRTNCCTWLCNYPKAPEYQIGEISQNIDAVYAAALAAYPAERIILLGDSVGGTLATALTQRLIRNNEPLPQKLILITPVMDASMSNPAIAAVDRIDPMLSRAGILSAKKMCAGDVALTDPIISPLYGSFAKFPQTLFFAAGQDIMYPDQVLAIQKLRAAKVPLEVIEEVNMPHIWPFLPVMKEAKFALGRIVEEIGA